MIGIQCCVADSQCDRDTVTMSSHPRKMSTSSDEDKDKDLPAAPHNVVTSQSQGGASQNQGGVIQSQGVVTQSQGVVTQSQGGASGECLFKLKNAVIKILGRFFGENIAPFDIMNLFRFLS